MGELDSFLKATAAGHLQEDLALPLLTTFLSSQSRQERNRFAHILQSAFLYFHIKTKFPFYKKSVLSGK